MSQLYNTFNDLVPEVIIKIENRTTDTLRVLSHIANAVSEITSNPDYRDDFNELEVLGPLFNLVIGTQEYADSNIMPATSTTITQNINMASLDILLWQDPPTNSVRRKLDYNTFQETDKFSVINSQPTDWYRFGSNIGFYPVPDKTYQIQSRVLQYYPITLTGVGGTVSATTPWILPPDWVIIVEWAAAMIGFMELEEFEKAAKIKTLLYGDQTKNPPEPGLIYSRKKRRVRENWRQEQRLRPVVRPFSYGRYGGR